MLGAAQQLFRAVAHFVRPGSEATRAVNMCKAWVTRAAAAAQRSLGTYKRPPECLMHSCIGAKARRAQLGSRVSVARRTPRSIESRRVGDALTLPTL
eukprot:5793296-Prymnesium_polylepis.2